MDLIQSIIHFVLFLITNDYKGIFYYCQCMFQVTGTFQTYMDILDVFSHVGLIYFILSSTLFINYFYFNTFHAGSITIQIPFL